MRIDGALAVAAAVLVSACGARSARPVVAPAAPPQLRVTKIVAYGDSQTEGFVQTCGPAPADEADTSSDPSSPDPVSQSPIVQDRADTISQGRADATRGVRPTQFSEVAYPVRLQAMLSERYASQTITVINEGVGGEEIRSGAADLPRVLGAETPEVLLLLEGINDINAGHGAAIPAVVAGLRRMIQDARSRGVTVFASTLLPEREGSCRAYDYADGTDDIVMANIQIRGMIGEEGAVLVDLYEAFNGRTALLLGEDGLHPSAAGYQTMADAFFAAIVQHLENRTVP